TGSQQPVHAVVSPRLVIQNSHLTLSIVLNSLMIAFPIRRNLGAGLGLSGMKLSTSQPADGQVCLRCLSTKSI
ncbi:MAG TPA: hypothetical protein VJL34_02205, partial [Anaerolineales bacterium]|nr:hypothetical protein [Anaerolineales bacterium]